MLKGALLYFAQNQHARGFVINNRIARRVSRRFVAGEQLEEAVQVTRTLNQRDTPVALDYLGENVTEVGEAEATTRDYIAALDVIQQSGIDANLSIKLTALGLDISQRLCRQQLQTLCEQANQRSIFICIDMEGSAYTERTIATTLDIHQEFRQVGTVIQACLYRSRGDIEQLVKEGIRLRLVKGAYREPGSIAYQSKKDVDRTYVELMQFLLSHGNFPAIATHDEACIREACDYVRAQGVSKDSFEFQMLYGIRRDLQEKLIKEGYNVRVYVPYGMQWYPYLMRRMAERPANLLFVVSNTFR